MPIRCPRFSAELLRPRHALGAVIGFDWPEKSCNLGNLAIVMDLKVTPHAATPASKLHGFTSVLSDKLHLLEARMIVCLDRGPKSAELSGPQLGLH